MKDVRIWNFSGPYFPAFGLNTDQKNSKYGDFLRSVRLKCLGTLDDQANGDLVDFLLIIVL